MNTSIKIVLDSKPMSNGQHTIYLRIIKDRQSKKIALSMKCEKKYFDNEQFLKGHENYKEQNKLLISLKARAEKIVRDFQLDGNNFSLEDFENKFKGKSDIKNVKVSVFYDELIDELERSGRMGYAKSFRDTKKSFLKFTGSSILFKDINSILIEKYEVYLRENNNQNGGIAFKMRHLRVFFNKAIKRGVMHRDNYPFEVYKVSKIKPENNKRAVSIDEFKKIRDVNLSGYPELIEAYNYFMFSVFTRGMNFADMAKLQWTDIQNGRIYYNRSKTKKSFSIEVNEKIQEILDYYQNEKRQSPFVFPILLKEDMTPKQIQYRLQKVLTRYNLKLKKIAVLAGVEKNLTSYVARHSFATILKSLGTSVEKISEMMGHGNVQITMSYLKDFENEDLDIENRKLLDL